MADGYFPTLVSKSADVNAVSNPIFVELSDGTSAVTVTGGSLSVNVANTVPVTGTFWQTTQPISGSVTVSNAGGASAVNIQDGGNSITVDGSLSVSNFPATVAVTQSTSPWVVDGSAVTQPVSGTFWQATQPVSGSVSVSNFPSSVEVSNDTGNPLPISATTAVNSSGNPIYVSAVTAAITGAVSDYATATVAATSSSNHDYTVVTSMKVTAVSFSCSGGGKVELKTGPLATLVSQWVGFVPKQGGEVKMEFNPPIVVPTTSTGTVRLVMNNRENQSQDLYSTIVGIDA
jgi:hypothetical protein